MKAVIETIELKRLIKATAKFISKDDYRPMLQYIKLEFEKDTLFAKAVAVDGYRIAVEQAKCFSVDESFTVFIRPYLPVGATARYSEIELIDGKCLININGNIAGYTQPTGEFVNDKEIVAGMEAQDITFKIAIDRDFLMEALRTMQFDKLTRRQAVTMEFRSGVSPMSIKTKNGAKYILPCRGLE